MSTTTIISPAHWRRAKDRTWVVCGPASDIRVGPVPVRKKDGTTSTVTIESVGKPFDIGVTSMVYGYPVLKKSSARRSNLSGRDERRIVPDRCTDCGGLLSDWDLRGASVPGYHFDCA